MRKIVFLSAALSLSFAAFAQKVNEQTAKLVAVNFLGIQSGARTSNDLTLTYTSASNTATKGDANFYVFNLANGFVIVSGNESAKPILAYSKEHRFDPANMSAAMHQWFDGYSNDISLAEKNNMKPSISTTAKWADLKNGKSGIGERTQAVDPLVKTKWDRVAFYSAACPTGSEAGSVAVSMAQLMKFWNYPASGSGFYSDNDPNFGSLSANFAGTVYDWPNMPNSAGAANPAIANLIFQSGVSVNTRYGETSYADIADAPAALKKYFGYHTSTQLVQRSNYTDLTWPALITTELQNGRPVIYGGTAVGGSQTFICDGFDDKGFFSFNWGWGGSNDGYFTLDALDPVRVGVHNGFGAFDSYQQAVIGIQPPPAVSGGTYSMQLNNFVSTPASSISYGQPFKVACNIANLGTQSFLGDYAVAVFDVHNSFIGFIEIKSNISLSPNNSYLVDLVFSSDGIAGMVPGVYNMMVLYRSSSEWMKIADRGVYLNSVQITVTNTSDIQLNTALTASPDQVFTQGQPASINFGVINNGANSFTGNYYVRLYKTDAAHTIAQSLGVRNESVGLAPGSTSNVNFSSDAISVAPGTYLLEVRHQPTTGAVQLTGNGAFSNPVFINVVAPALAPDQYESNDAVSDAASLPLVFSGNVGTVSTTGSNLNSTADFDYYKITLPDALFCIVNATLADRVTGNANIYSLEGLLSYSTDGVTWSNAFQSTTPAHFGLNGGGDVYFLVSGYLTGETGAYKLDISVTTSTITGITSATTDDAITLYPNPATDRLYIDTRSFKQQLNSVSLLNLQGETLMSQINISANEILEWSLTGLREGVYVVRFYGDKSVISKKIVVKK